MKREGSEHVPPPRSPAVTADVIIVNGRGEIALIKRKNPPFQGDWALPGGFIDYGKETIEDCAVREAWEETSLSVKLARLLGVWSHPDRDPRGHTITAVYITEPVTDDEMLAARPADDASELIWLKPTSENLDRVAIAFDHRTIIRKALEHGLCGGTR